MLPSPVRTASLPRALTKADLRWLACPACHGTLVFEETPSQQKVLQNKSVQPENGYVAITCTACNRSYPLEEGLPVLLTSRVTSSL